MTTRAAQRIADILRKTVSSGQKNGASPVRRCPVHTVLHLVLRWNAKGNETPGGLLLGGREQLQSSNRSLDCGEQECANGGYYDIDPRKQGCLRLGEREAGSPPVAGTTDLGACVDQRKSSRFAMRVATRAINPP